MKNVFTILARSLAAGKDAVLCSIVEDHGSAPRGSGAKMAVFSDGSTMGTVGGGALEYRTSVLAADALQKRCSRLEEFHLAPGAAADIGMICGGDVSVHIGFIPAGEKTAALFQKAAAFAGAAEETWLLTEVEGAAASIGIYAKTGLCFGEGPDAGEVRELFCSRPKRNAKYYAEPLGCGARVFVFGGGHVSQQLVPTLARVDFSVFVYEDRAEFARKELFPDAEGIILAPYTQVLSKVSIGERDHAVILTRGHMGDYEVLRQVLQTGAAYIGVIGSRRKAAAAREKLMLEGFSEADIARVHSPVGLAIGAETPQEIAVSIAAEMILERAKKTGGKHL